MAGHPDDATRVGNPERERAIAHLNDAFAQGYLDVAEFEERSERVYASRTRGDLRGVLEHFPIAGALFPDATVMTAGSMTPSAVPTRPVELEANWDTVRRKGVWDAPASLLLTGTMGTIDLDFTSAVLAGPVTTVQLQVSTSTIKIRVGPDHAVRTSGLARSGWSTLKDKAGEPTRPGGPVVELTGSMSAMSGLTLRRTA
ncbi:DUF1707 SHOCT-like domain-containing protein [Williamsia serinedens]|uniref:DUF1707 domain-containing protein n=1 Tax=Williamsia serinedens TaxID=391736 RepID=A0ABT1GV95_9NOCA|nr:DUF1707 domain-containing protein [Williamsia serinedens]MCP2158891.1 protein of unknown function (DUF1707) [Williamsia serinedens]